MHSHTLIIEATKINNWTPRMVKEAQFFHVDDNTISLIEEYKAWKTNIVKQ